MELEATVEVEVAMGAAVRVKRAVMGVRGAVMRVRGAVEKACAEIEVGLS